MSDLFDIGIVDDDRQEIGFREIAIVVGDFFGAHRSGRILLGVIQARFLGDTSTTVQNVSLTFVLAVNGALNKPERIHVLDFGARTELIRALFAQRNIDIAAHGALGHVAIRDAQIGHQ